MPCPSDWSVSPAVRLMPTEGGALLLDLSTDNYYTLNHTGEQVWQALVRGEGPEGAASALRGSYGLPLSEARRFVDSFIKELARESLISNDIQAI